MNEPWPARIRSSRASLKKSIGSLSYSSASAWSPPSLACRVSCLPSSTITSPSLMHYSWAWSQYRLSCHFGLISAIVIFVVTGFTADAVEDPSLIVIFFAAAVAICALIMPGVSGSLILLMLGLYQPVIAAVSERNLTIIVVFIAGAICG